jgi:hypothetical protein
MIVSIGSYTCDIPDECPYCKFVVHHSQLPQGGHIVDNKWKVLFQCPRGECREYYFGNFIIEESKFPVFVNFLGGNIILSEFNEIIVNISQKFISIFNEAETAEYYGLSSLCGAGYRKALEYLIKDYLIKKKPELESVLGKLTLGNCIRGYVDNPNVKDCAQRATWIGNDEVHYIKIWEGKDLSHLKDLISLTISWIELEVKTQNFIKEMPERKKKD